MPRPMPNGPASASRVSITVTGDAGVPSSLTGTPRSKPMAWRSGARGLSKALPDNTQASSGMLPSEVSVSLPPMVTPQSPRLTE